MSAWTSRSALASISRTATRIAARPVTALPSTFLSSRAPAAALLASSQNRSTTRSPQDRRSFFSLPDISKLAGLASSLTNSSDTGVQIDGELQKFHARKISPYSQAQLYSLIADVPSYSTFIPFCTQSRVLVDSAESDTASPQRKRRATRKDWKPDDRPFQVDAELIVGFGGLEERYISRVVGSPFESVTATASEQIPIFKSLVTTWSFSPASTLSPHPTTNPLTSPSARASASSPQISENRPTNSNSVSPTDPKQGPTLLTIDIAFAFINPLHRIASQAVLPKVADKMVEAFERRCLAVWGKGSA